MGSRRTGIRKDYEAVPLPIGLELLAGVEMLYLRMLPVYWGFGVPRGDGSAVVVIPGFMLTDLYLTEFRIWLRRIGYQPYSSGIGVNAAVGSRPSRKPTRKPGRRSTSSATASAAFWLAPLPRRCRTMSHRSSR